MQNFILFLFHLWCWQAILVGPGDWPQPVMVQVNIYSGTILLYSCCSPELIFDPLSFRESKGVGKDHSTRNLITESSLSVPSLKLK